MMLNAKQKQKHLMIFNKSLGHVSNQSENWTSKKVDANEKWESYTTVSMQASPATVGYWTRNWQN